MPNQLFFLANTNQQVAGCRYFLLKYLAVYNLKPPASTTVIVYTNEPVAFEGFTSFFPNFQMPGLQRLPGNATKTAILHHHFLHNEKPALYCNADTYPLQALEPLFADIGRGSLYLHSPHRYKESELNIALRRFSSVLDKTKTTADVSSPARINIWHAAVVGISSGNKEKLAAILHEESPSADALALDYAYTKEFSESAKIKSAGKYIFDYSDFKEFSQLLDAFFKKTEEESIPNQVKALHHIDASAIRQQRDQYHQQPFFKKWLHTITGKRWNIKQYETKF